MDIELTSIKAISTSDWIALFALIISLMAFSYTIIANRKSIQLIWDKYLRSDIVSLRMRQSEDNYASLIKDSYVYTRIRIVNPSSTDISLYDLSGYSPDLDIYLEKLELINDESIRRVKTVLERHSGNKSGTNIVTTYLLSDNSLLLKSNSYNDFLVIFHLPDHCKEIEVSFKISKRKHWFSIRNEQMKQYTKKYKCDEIIR